MVPADQGAGLIGATVGALLALFIWNRLVVHHVVSDPGGSGPTPGRPTDRDGGAFLRPWNQRFTALPPVRSGAQRSDNKEADMGLRDILTGMQNGPRGQPQPSSGGGSGGMSPIVIALLGLLAYKAYKGRGGQAADAGGAGQTARLPQGGRAQPGNAGGGLGDVLGGLFGGKPAGAPAGTTSGGNLGDLLSGGLGGLLGGAAAGSVLSGGLGNLLRGFQESGHGHTANSWVGTGPNKAIAPERPGRCTRQRYARYAEPADRHGTK